PPDQTDRGRAGLDPGHDPSASGTAAPASTPAIPLGPVTPRERRGQVYRDMVELVEIEAPGATTPGHPGYQSGVHSRIAQITSTAGLRSLPGRGPGGTFGRATTRFHFRHHGFGGERLVEVALAAVPRRSQDLAGVRGVSHPGSGFEQWQSHTAAGRTTSKSWVRQKQLGVNLTTRHLRRNQPPGQSRVDRSAPVLTPQAATSKSSRRATTADNRFWLRTDNGADFDGLEYDYVVSVRSVLVMDWPPNVLGGLIQNGVIAWEQASVNTRRWLDELLERGRPQTRSTPVRLALRFTGTETNTRTTPASVTAPAAVSTVDPRNRLLPGPPPTPYLTDSQMFSPTGPTPVFHFDGWAHLETALNEVTPISDGGWHVQLTGASLEGRAARLGQLVQAGRISLDRPRLVAGLLRRMPGSRPLEGPPTQPPSLTITLYNPRRATHGDDVTLDQLHNVTDTLSTAAGADHTFSVGFTELLSADADGHQLAGMSVPIVQRPAQPTSFGGTVTGSRRDWLKHGSTSAPGDGAWGTRSYAIDAGRCATPPYGPLFLRTVVPAARGWVPEPVRAPAPARAGRAPGPAEWARAAWARAPAASERVGSAPEVWGPAGRAPGPAEPDRVRVSARAWAPAVSARGPASAPAAQGRDTAASCCPPAIGTSALDYSPAYPRPDRAVTRSPARNRGNPPGRPVGVRRRTPWNRVAQNRSG
ncbi:hypothetical protein HCJ99_30565, partial [Streptomyces sp. C1-2]|nr:hypothetical protein [Streptomyces sp. C1-2]